MQCLAPRSGRPRGHPVRLLFCQSVERSINRINRINMIMDYISKMLEDELCNNSRDVKLYCEELSATCWIDCYTKVVHMHYAIVNDSK